MTRPVDIDVSVRIGDLQVLGPGSTGRLVTVGLGSCVGVALVDPRTGTVALAHVFLPEAPPSGPKPGAGAGTYAELAVPELVRSVERAVGARARAHQFLAIVAGGAQMFGARSGADVGERNVAAVRTALLMAGVTVAAEDVGGSKGRTMRVEAGTSPAVTVRVVGSPEQELWSTATSIASSARLAA